MYFGTFESELSVEEVCRAIENRIEKGRIANWDKKLHNWQSKEF